MPCAPRSTPTARHTAIELRKEPTPAESKLWACLRNDQLGVTFRRQHAIGPYIVDFCALKRKLIIELDGSQHLDQEEYDSDRTAYLNDKGYRVLRFWNRDVLNKINEVMGVVLEELEKLGPARDMNVLSPLHLHIPSSFLTSSWIR